MVKPFLGCIDDSDTELRSKSYFGVAAGFSLRLHRRDAGATL
jgi:hypothetical protein